MSKNKHYELPMPLEYCTIARASRLLGCEKSDLLHLAKIDAIGLYLKFDCVKVAVSMQYEETMCEESGKKIVTTPQKYLTQEHWQFNDGLSRLYYFDSEIEAGLENKSYADALIEGLWKTDFNWLQNSNELYLKGYDPESTLSFDVSYELEDEEFLILDLEQEALIIRSDLIKVYDAMENGTRLISESVNFSQPHRRTVQRAPRTEPLQSNMIKALLACLPDLQRDLDSSPKSLAPKIIDEYLLNKGLNPLNIGDKNFENWMKKATYTQKDN